MSNQCEHGQLARVCYTCEQQARVAELDRLNTDLAMESHALQAKIAELEAKLMRSFEAAAAAVVEKDAQIAELEALVPRWISVDERLPEIGEWVLVSPHSNGLPELDRRINDNTRSFDSGDWCWLRFYKTTNTHWMPLPPTPPEDA